MKKIILSMVLVLILSGCAAVPDEVKDDMSTYRNSESSKSENSYFSYIKVEDLSSNAEAALNKEYEQFKISDKIKFDQPSEINIMSFADVTGFVKNADEALGLFFTDSELSAQNPEKDNEKLMFWNETDKLYGCVCNDGFIAMLKPDAFDISFSNQEPTVKIYHADRKDDLSDEYQLKDGKCSVGDAVEYINNWFENEYHQFSPEFDHKVETVIVREYEGNYIYEILVQAFYKGVPLDKYTHEIEEYHGQNDLKTTYCCYGIAIQMFSVNEISTFTNLTGIYKPTEIEKIDECISLESALEICKNTFTDFKDVTISDIDVMYTLHPVYEKEEEKKGEYAKVLSYDSRPVWAIIIDAQPEEFLAKGEINTHGDIRKYIYIDMITGELHYNLDIANQGR